MLHDSQTIAASKRIPCSTYRLQFNRHFTLRDALALVPYWDELGISDIYASPLFMACAESTHGYDVCDFTRLNPCLGTEEDFAALATALRARGMGLLLDMVPNHMGIADPANRWWMDVLEKGAASPFAKFFDIDWASAVPGLHGKVLLPVLGERFGTVLERGEFKLAWRQGAVRVTYFEHSFPVSTRGLLMILRRMAELPQSKASADSVAQCVQALERESQEHTLQSVPWNQDKPLDPGPARERIRQLVEGDPAFQAALEDALQRLNGQPGDRRSFDELEQLLDVQHYRLAWWRVAARELNYRRFFDVTSLAGLRVESPDVFSASHELLLRWLADGKVTGVRVDHPDGLREPAAYFSRLQRTFAERSHGREHDATGKPLYVVAEKILSPGEDLPREWLVDGATGYDFLCQLNALFVNPKNAAAFDEIYAEFTGESLDVEELIYSRKRFVLETLLCAETDALARQLSTVAVRQRAGRDFTVSEWRCAIVELISALQVYRTYWSADTSNPSSQDVKFLGRAIRRAQERNPLLNPALLDFIGYLFLSLDKDTRTPGENSALEFVLRFQQLSGPATAKGIEDTSFYIHNRLVALNEVGGDLARFGGGVQAFHDQNLARWSNWPHSLLATSTHDTKRGEDARARINVLSELPGEWRDALARWRALNANKKSVVAGKFAPDANDEYLLYQTLIGGWPDEDKADLASLCERIKAYALKAAREAKRHTSWGDPQPAYEEALLGFVEQLLQGKPAEPFLEDFRRFQKRAAYFGRFNSLAQTLLKITVPGVPDFYQGSELWNLRLVDPDNRRRVDFDARRNALAELKRGMEQDRAELLRGLAESGFDSRAKLFVTHVALQFRRGRERLFQDGEYVPLQIDGPLTDHVCAFARTLDSQAVVVLVPRLVVGLTKGAEVPPLGDSIWKNRILFLPGAPACANLKNVFTGEVLLPCRQERGASILLAEVFRSFPVAFLECSTS